jgi:hypothetical protein
MGGVRITVTVNTEFLCVHARQKLVLTVGKNTQGGGVQLLFKVYFSIGPPVSLAVSNIDCVNSVEENVQV